MRLPRLLGPAVLIGALLMPAAPASADITAFLGIAGGPTVREALGVALSGGPGVIGWELEVQLYRQRHVRAGRQLEPGSRRRTAAADRDGEHRHPGTR